MSTQDFGRLANSIISSAFMFWALSNLWVGLNLYRRQNGFAKSFADYDTIFIALLPEFAFIIIVGIACGVTSIGPLSKRD